MSNRVTRFLRKKNKGLKRKRQHFHIWIVRDTNFNPGISLDAGCRFLRMHTGVTQRQCHLRSGPGSWVKEGTGHSHYHRMGSLCPAQVTKRKAARLWWWVTSTNTSLVGALHQLHGLVTGFLKWVHRAFNPQTSKVETTVLIFRMLGGRWTFSVFSHTRGVDHYNSRFKGSNLSNWFRLTVSE